MGTEVDLVRNPLAWNLYRVWKFNYKEGKELWKKQ